jgi:arylsulfatase A
MMRILDTRTSVAVLGGLLVLAGLVAGISGSAQQKPGSDAPNIIFIMADDLGYGELGSYGQRTIRTPRLDRMAAEGMRLTQFYAGSTVCAPSRATLLTGLHTGHAYVRDNHELGGFPDEEERGQLALPPDTPTLARALSSRGYTTAIIGKWGLGGPGSTGVPTRQGFGLFFGYLDQKQAHNFYPTHLWRNEERYPLRNTYFSPHQKHDGNPEDPAAYRKYSGTDYAIDAMTREARAFVASNRDKPFFLYFAPTLPHLALQVPEAAIAEYAGAFPDPPYLGEKGYLPHRTPRAAYAAMITYLDAQVGTLLDTVRDAGLDDRTIIFFTSDNGATFDIGGAPTAFFNSNGPLRGHKTEVYEGGIRVPMIVRWPGRIAGGTTSDHVSANWDMWATFSDLTGAPVRGNTDGFSMLPALLGQRDGRKHDFLYWEYHSKGSSQAVRMGRWKGIRNNVRISPNGSIELYDLEADLTEKLDVSGKHPDIVRRIDEIMRASHTPSPLKKWTF